VPKGLFLSKIKAVTFSCVPWWSVLLNIGGRNLREDVLVINLSDNFGRRSGVDRRQASHPYDMERRRAGTDRRSVIDRRFRLERRNGGERRNSKRLSFGMDRRNGRDRRSGHEQMDLMMN
jgi:hypothetical protein